MTKSKILSFFLAFIMVLAMFPAQVFADVGINMDTGTVPIGKGSGSVGWQRQGQPDGYRISVWFAKFTGYENGNVNKPTYDWDNAFQIGENLNLRKEKLSSNPTIWGTNNIFNYVNQGDSNSSWKFDRFIKGSTAFRCAIWSDDLSVFTNPGESAQERINRVQSNAWGAWEKIQSTLDPKSDAYNKIGEFVDKDKRLSLNAGDLGIPLWSGVGESASDTNVFKGYFSNPFVLNNISYSSTAGTSMKSWMPNDFIYGRYDADGDKVYEYHGSYKIFIEPLYFANYDGYYTGMTWQEMIAIDRHSKNKDLSTVENSPTRARMTANAGKLIAPDSSLVYSDGTMMGSLLSSSSKVFNKEYSSAIRSAYLPTAFGGNYLGVLVLTSPSVEEKPVGPQVIKTYVTIDSVDANGNVTYKKAAESTIESAQFLTDTDGNITQTPIFDFEETIDAGSAVLNDIVSTDKDLAVTNKTIWENTDLITEVGVDLLPTSMDIAGNATALVTGSEVFINSVITAIQEEPGELTRERSTQIGIDGVKDYVDAGANEKELGTLNSVISEISAYRNVGSLSQGRLQIVLVESVPYVYIGDIKLGRLVDGHVEKIIKEDTQLADYLKQQSTTTGKVPITPANNLVLRYVVIPKAKQVNVIEIVDETEGKSIFVSGGVQDLDITDTIVNIQNPDTSNLPEDLGEPEKVEWVTNSEIPIININDGNLPPVSDGGTSGGPDDDMIMDYPKEPVIHNLYVKWKVIIKKPGSEPTETKFAVPEWRLSKYWKAYESVPKTIATMSLPVRYGCCSEYLTNSGAWNYTTRNPNGQLTLPGHIPSNLKLLSWVHSEAVHSGQKPYIGIYNPGAVVSMSSTLNAIKSTDTSGIKAAKWIEPSVTGLLNYDVNNDVKGSSFTKSEYVLNTAFAPLAYNIDTYTNGWTVSIPNPFFHIHYWTSRDLEPGSAGYGVLPIPISVKYDRYVQQNTDSKKLVVTPEVKSENAKTTLKYQLDKTLNIYPEYGLLFTNDSMVDAIKWVVGDQARKLNPVVYQTLQHKVYVVPSSNGTSVATDSRALTNANKLGESNKQVVYKGAGLNTAFKVLRDEKNSNVGLLTVKTYALDFKESANVKSAWGNGEYNSKAQHTALLASIDKQKIAKSTEKLLIDSPAYNSLDYNGAIKSQDTANYKKVSYSGDNTTDDGTVTIFTHELLVRGGAVIGVNVMSRDGKETQKLVSISDYFGHLYF